MKGTLVNLSLNKLIVPQVKDQQEAEKKKVTSMEIQATIEVRVALIAAKNL